MMFRTLIKNKIKADLKAKMQSTIKAKIKSEIKAKIKTKIRTEMKRKLSCAINAYTTGPNARPECIKLIKLSRTFKA
jgi:acetylglutamate kinase